MKELSIEEKAKAYDMALENAKHYHSEMGDDVCCVLEECFPILIESEESKNERIRKALISVLKSDFEKDTTIYDISVGDILVWLEKQGELVEEYEDKLDRCACENFNEGYKKALEKQGEQKSVDKVEPIVVRDFNSVFSREQVEEIDKRIEESQRLYNAKLRDALRKAEDFPMTN